MTHIGYCNSCYGREKPTYVFSAPISLTRESLLKILNRENMINGEPLSENEFWNMRNHVIGDVEIGCDGRLDCFLEGHNLPEECSDWE